MISDDSEPLHTLKWFLNPKEKLLQVEVIGGVSAIVLGALAVQNCQQPIVLSQLCLDDEAQTLCHLINALLLRCVLLKPLTDFFVEPTELVEF